MFAIPSSLPTETAVQQFLSRLRKWDFEDALTALLLFYFEDTYHEQLENLVYVATMGALRDALPLLAADDATRALVTWSKEVERTLITNSLMSLSVHIVANTLLVNGSSVQCLPNLTLNDSLDRLVAGLIAVAAGVTELKQETKSATALYQWILLKFDRIEESTRKATAARLTRSLIRSP